MCYQLLEMNKDRCRTVTHRHRINMHPLQSCNHDTRPTNKLTKNRVHRFFISFFSYPNSTAHIVFPSGLLLKHKKKPHSSQRTEIKNSWQHPSRCMHVTPSPYLAESTVLSCSGKRRAFYLMYHCWEGSTAACVFVQTIFPYNNRQ